MQPLLPLTFHACVRLSGNFSSSKPVRNNAVFRLSLWYVLLNCRTAHWGRYSACSTVLRSSAQILLSLETNRYFPSLSLGVPGAVVGCSQLEAFRFKCWKGSVKYRALTWRVAGCVGLRAGLCKFGEGKSISCRCRIWTPDCSARNSLTVRIMTFWLVHDQ